MSDELREFAKAVRISIEDKRADACNVNNREVYRLAVALTEALDDADRGRKAEEELAELREKWNSPLAEWLPVAERILGKGADDADDE